MCGFAGIIAIGKEGRQQQDADDMIHAIGHRGPDALGKLDMESGDAFISLRHARLSIIDLSENGMQPRSDSVGDTIIIFNGEIYNYLDLKSKLVAEDVRFDSDTDTEVLLKGINHWGVTEMLNLVDGMYAFAHLNVRTKEITLARDSFGEKPLYYYIDKTHLLFASQPKAIKQIKSGLAINPQAVYNYFKYSYIPAPLTIYQNVNKLKNGECIRLNYEKLTIRDSWSIKKGITSTEDTRTSHTYNEGHFKKMLIESVRKRCIADVPVSAFLSGGIDSSLAVAIVKKEIGLSLDTFTIGFEDKQFDESPYATEIAKKIGVANTVFFMGDNDIEEACRLIADIYDEPFCDSSQIPTSFLCRKLQGVYKVALTGDGGDELVVGYPRYGLFDKRSAYGVPLMRSNVPVKGRPQPGKIRMGLNYLINGDKIRLYDYTISRNKSLASLLSASYLAQTADTPIIAAGEVDTRERGLFMGRNIDLMSYLPDELLVKTDRASMYYGLELRTPFLNSELFRYINATSTVSDKFEPKTKLKNVLAGYVPMNLIERPKKGFSVPISAYLKTYLHADLEREIFDREFLTEQGIFNPSFLETAYHELMHNTATDGYLLWSFFVFQKWYRKFVN